MYKSLFSVVLRNAPSLQATLPKAETFPAPRHALACGVCSCHWRTDHVYCVPKRQRTKLDPEQAWSSRLKRRPLALRAVRCSAHRPKDTSPTPSLPMLEPTYPAYPVAPP